MPISSFPVSPRPGRRGAATRTGLAAVACAALVGLTGCGSSGSSGSSAVAAGGPAPTAAATVAGTASADLGDLHIRGAYIPQQASDTEAAAYLTITDSGGTPDALTAVTTPLARSVTLHTTVTSGGAETMRALSQLPVPAHGTAAFTVGHNHLMLTNPVRRLTRGQQVPLTLTFAHAGTVTLTVPVVGFTGPRPTDDSMPGMDMSTPG
ncbi:copper chaperone PCu(A)C [Frankia sp. AgKG'84/4]|uniref:copper chaperone PCu(A)C n=1 Tax=Frankia sp. AgKG'84/4 TaxID=573490 RepID=UPI00200D04EB|nr:copper chaperone PCu(A)C [Frankia sp. AgKG'84/4]MCL9797323.1 copper chaperone PCu(A)C [Frankia sp. AgKG'84/4]